LGGGVVAALGFYHVTQTVAVRISPRASTKAIAVVTVWGAFSSFIYLPASAWLVENHGWRPAMVVLSVSAAAAFLVAALAMSTRTKSMPRSLHLVSELRAALRTPAARSFLVSQGIVGVVMGIVSAYQVPAMTAAGLSLSTASFWAGFRGLSQLLGRLPHAYGRAFRRGEIDADLLCRDGGGRRRPRVRRHAAAGRHLRHRGRLRDRGHLPADRNPLP